MRSNGHRRQSATRFVCLSPHDAIFSIFFDSFVLFLRSANWPNAARIEAAGASFSRRAGGYMTGLWMATGHACTS